MAAAQFWYPECGGQSLRRTHPHRRDHLTPTTSRRVGLLDGGLHGSDQQRPSALSLAADFSPALGSVAFAPGVRLRAIRHSRVEEEESTMTQRKGARGRRKAHHIPEVLTAAEPAALLKQTMPRYPTGLRNRFLILVMLDCGLGFRE